VSFKVTAIRGVEEDLADIGWISYLVWKREFEVLLQIADRLIIDVSKSFSVGCRLCVDEVEKEKLVDVVESAKGEPLPVNNRAATQNESD
jgi:hypothetical protein